MTGLGKGKIRQVSINSNVDQVIIAKKLLRFLEDYKPKKKDLARENFISEFKITKKLPFMLNKHEEIYSNKIKDPNKFVDYITFRYKFRTAGTKKISYDVPPYILIEPVSTCNLKCPFCFQVDKSFTKKPYMGLMNFDLFKKVVDDASEENVGAITMGSRGEPTLHKKFAEMLKYLKNKNFFEIKLNTNGSHLTEELSHVIFETEVNQIVISSDHYIKEDYEKLRVGANFDDIVKRVDKLYDIRKKYYPNSDTEIRISGIDNEKNLDRAKFHDFWIRRSDHVSAGYPLPRWDTYNNEIHEDINDPCEMLWDRMYVWFDGKVNPCDSDYKSYLSYGNCKTSSIREVWSSKKIQMIRKEHLNNNRLKIDPCNKCGKNYI